jgi:hypothetical protein
LTGTKKQVKLLYHKPLYQEPLMPINETYRTWIQRICELRPKQRKTQVQNFVWLLAGIFHSRSVSLSKIAGKVISTAKNVSTVRRLSRFLASSAVDVRSGYRSTAKNWLVAQAQQVGEIRLIVDGTKIGFGYQLLMVSLAYRHRAVPIAWTWIRHVRGTAVLQNRLSCEKPDSTKNARFSGWRQRIWLDCSLAAATTVALIPCSASKGNTGLWLDERSGWQRLDSFVQHAGQSVWCPNGSLTQSGIFPVSVLIHWQIGEKEPWCLATNLPDAALTLRYYRRRVWIEEMFADFKKTRL